MFGSIVNSIVSDANSAPSGGDGFEQAQDGFAATQGTSAIAPPSNFIDNKGTVTHVNDYSNAVYAATGSGVNLHYTFMGFDPSQGGYNVTNLQTAEYEQQILNLSNPALQQDAAGNTFCNYATQNVLSTLASASANGQALLQITGQANPMTLALEASSLFQTVNSSVAATTATNGQLAILGYNSHGEHGHVATFSVGPNLNTGIIANIGPSSRTGFVGIGPGDGQVFTTQSAASNAEYFILSTPLVPIGSRGYVSFYNFNSLKK